MPGTPPLFDENADALRERLKTVTAALAAQKARCARLESGLPAAASREQQRLAQTLHDTVSQNLSGMQLMAAVLARKYATICPAAAAEITQLSDLILASATEMHQLIGRLRSSPADPAE